MKRLSLFALAVVCCLCLMVATERRAYGYVDPGSGLLALQSIGSVAAATAYFMRRQLKALFSRKPKAEPVVLPMDAMRATTAEKRNVA